MSILSVDQISPIGSGTTITLNATEVKTGNEITVGTGASIFSPAGNTLTLGTNNVERIRIKNDGKVGIATETGSGLINTRHAGTNQQVLHVRADLGSSNGRSLNLYTPDTDNTNAPFRFQTGNGYLFQCDSENVFTIAHDRTIGIGTNNPTAKLEVKGSNNPLVKIVQDTSGIARLNIESATNDGYQYSGIGLGDGTNDAELMWTTQGFDINVGNAVRFRIDSSGNITKPNSFHILVDRSSNQTGYNASNLSDNVIWNRVQSSQSSTNASNHFDTSTGLFTAPVTGLYLFHVSVNCNYNVQGAWLNINGSRPNFTAFYPNGSTSADGMITYKVTAGQTVGTKWYYNGQTNGTINSNSYHTWWRIVLLG